MLVTVVLLTACAAFAFRTGAPTPAPRAAVSMIDKPATIGEGKVVVSGISDSRPGTSERRLGPGRSYENMRDSPAALNTWTNEFGCESVISTVSSSQERKATIPTATSKPRSLVHTVTSTSSMLPAGITHSIPGVFGSYERKRDGPASLNQWTESFGTNSISRTITADQAEEPTIGTTSKATPNAMDAVSSYPSQVATVGGGRVVVSGIHSRPGRSYDHMLDSPASLDKWTSEFGPKQL